MATVFLILGGNLGDRYAFMNAAKKSLIENAGNILSQSSVYETEPWGFEHENQFLNQVIFLETFLEPLALLKEIKKIEKNLGRIKSKERYSARVIDIDILFYDRLIITSPKLTIPHPEIPNRRFVLEPLAELDADFVHPVSGLSVRVILENCLDKGIVKDYNERKV